MSGSQENVLTFIERRYRRSEKRAPTVGYHGSAHTGKESIVRVRIGIGDTSREVELDVPDADALIGEIEHAFATEKPMLWFTDVKDRRVGVPLARIAYVEFEPDHKVSVGFASD